MLTRFLFFFPRPLSASCHQAMLFPDQYTYSAPCDYSVDHAPDQKWLSLDQHRHDSMGMLQANRKESRQ